MEIQTSGEQQVRVRVEDDRAGIYVGPRAILALREAAVAQFNERLREVVDEWDAFIDWEDIEQVKNVRFRLGVAIEAVETLFYLAPIPEEDETS